MHLTINGSPHDGIAADTVEGVLHELGLDPRAVVVELNREIVRRPVLADTAVREGDVLEIVHFVGGG